MSPTMSGLRAGHARRRQPRRSRSPASSPDVYFRIVAHARLHRRRASRACSRRTSSIGTELAKDLGVSVGDKISVHGGNRRDHALTITGIFDLGNKGANQRTTFVALRTAQSLLGLVGGVTTIDLTVTDVYAAETIAQRIRRATGVEADSWIKTNAQFFTAVNAQQTSNTLIRFFVGLSVAFGIASVLVVSVIQRSKEIGILRAMGIIARPDPARVPAAGRAARLLRLDHRGGASAVRPWCSGTAMLRQADGSELFPLVIEPSLFIDRRAAGGRDRGGRGRGAGAACARNSIRWWRSVADASSCDSRRSARSYNVGHAGRSRRSCTTSA